MKFITRNEQQEISENQDRNNEYKPSNNYEL